MYHKIFIKTKNIAVDEIERIICQHLQARAHTYFDGGGVITRNLHMVHIVN